MTHKHVKTRGGYDAIIIDMDGPIADWPIAAWVNNDGWILESFGRKGTWADGLNGDLDLMLETHQYRNEYEDGDRNSYWKDNMAECNKFQNTTRRIAISRRTLDMDGNMTAICLVNDEGSVL
jgi:hypothetical protein